jgi:hypothetical protein
MPPGFTPAGNLHGASSGTLYTVAQTVASSVVLGPSACRNGAFFFNDTNVGNCLLAFSTTASLGVYTMKLAPSASFSAPYPTYCGPVAVAWDAAGSGKLHVTETS